MNKLIRSIWIFLLALLLAGCDDGVYSGTLIFEGSHAFGPATSLPGDVLLRAGTAEFSAGSQMNGSVYVVGGELLTNGRIAGDLIVLDGTVTLGPSAVVEGDLRRSGGTTQLAETAVVQGETITGLALPLEDAAQPTGWEATARWLVGALLLAALGGLLTRWQSQPLHNVADAATVHWLPAAALGVLGLLVLPTLLVMMAFTIVLLPLVIILGLFIFLVWGLGIVSLGAQLGRWLAEHLPRPLSPGWATFGGTLLLMALYALPGIGGLLLAGTAVLLFGAVLLSRFGTQTFKPPATTIRTGDLSAYERP
ncbi:MAG: hypothetical protein CL608_21325 [Anaerolineaceae bacterium]|nr:hypothetical protein [Anaerolineaceae bacterium]